MLESFGVLFIVLFIVGIFIGIIKLVDYFNDISYRLESLEHKKRIEGQTKWNHIIMDRAKKDTDLSRLKHLEAHLTGAISKLEDLTEKIEKQNKSYAVVGSHGDEIITDGKGNIVK